MFKYLNTPSKGSRHTNYTFVTDTKITHLLKTDRFFICYQTEALKDTAFHSLGHNFKSDHLFNLTFHETFSCEDTTLQVIMSISG